MKKIFALLLALTMMMVAAFACAEATYTYSEYSYDEEMFAEIGGEWLALEDFGLAFYMPDIYLTAEIPEALAAVGAIAAFGTEDASSNVFLLYGQALNVAGEAAQSVEELAANYSSVGKTNVDVIVVNGIPVITSLDEKNDMIGYSIFFADSTQMVMLFTPASDANTALLGGLTITSLMIME